MKVRSLIVDNCCSIAIYKGTLGVFYGRNIRVHVLKIEKSKYKTRKNEIVTKVLGMFTMLENELGLGAAE